MLLLQVQRINWFQKLKHLSEWLKDGEEYQQAALPDLSAVCCGAMKSLQLDGPLQAAICSWLQRENAILCDSMLR
jgi:hypothetical protein